MKLDVNNEKPIFVQFAEIIEDNILKGVFAEETQIPSTTEVAVMLKINPATANRGVNLLVDEEIVYKKRGIGMFVANGARVKIIKKRKNEFSRHFLLPLLEEAKKLNITKNEIKIMLDEVKNDE